MNDHEKRQYPELEIDLSKIRDNALNVIGKCSTKKVTVCGVVKSVSASPLITRAFIEAGCSEIGDSRLHHLKGLRDFGIIEPLLLTRLPMMSEVEELVSYVDISLNSEIEVIKKIDEEAAKINKIHKVILMFDLGDLREGLIDQNEFIDTACFIESKLKHVLLYGIGTNLGCYGSLKPTKNNLSRLVHIAEIIEPMIGRTLEVISGGSTTSYTLVLNDQLPARINHLRIGEGILLAKDLDVFWGLDMTPLYQDAFTLNAQLVELKDKPSYPDGEKIIDTFGDIPIYKDIGIRRRAILAIGKQDFGYHHDKLTPKDNRVKIVGGSFDHLIVDLEDCKNDYSVGGLVAFDVLYPPLVYLSSSISVTKRFRNNQEVKEVSICPVF
jgi:ornithine racemase